MPIEKYFSGHGEEVMSSIRKAHPGASKERIKAEFYATANKRKQKPQQKRVKGLGG